MSDDRIDAPIGGMTWNYRVVHRSTKPEGRREDDYTIREIYYDTDDDGVIMWSSVDATPSGTTLDELRRDLDFMTAALDKPVLEYDKLPRAGSDLP